MSTYCIYCLFPVPLPLTSVSLGSHFSPLNLCDLSLTDFNLWNHIWSMMHSISLNIVLASELGSASQWLSGPRTFGKKILSAKMKALVLCLGLPAAIFLSWKEPAWNWHQHKRKQTQRTETGSRQHWAYWIKVCLKSVLFLEPMDWLFFI